MNRTECAQRRLEVAGGARGDGVTTALLDVAVGNAHRGERVVFWCRDAGEAQRVYRVAAELIYRQDDTGPDFDPDGLRVWWPGETARTSGALVFGYPELELRMRGFRASVVVNDGAVWRGPEPLHAHTVINGGWR